MAATVIDGFLQFASEHGASELADLKVDLLDHDSKLHDIFCWYAKRGERVKLTVAQLADSPRCRDCLGGTKVLHAVTSHARTEVKAYNAVRVAATLSSGRASATSLVKARQKLAEEADELRELTAEPGAGGKLARGALGVIDEALAAGRVDREQLRREAVSTIRADVGKPRTRDDTVVLAGWSFPIRTSTMRAVVDAWSVRDDDATLLAVPIWTVPWLVRKVGDHQMQVAVLPDGVDPVAVAALWAPRDSGELASLAAALRAAELLDEQR